ncbi:MAG: hypothetical protein JNK27_13540 [Chitinophagaceae bacterium]|nr:hypothetical protein [Chitinophagaceae bacterium]
MTRYFILTAIFLVTFVTASSHVYASIKEAQTSKKAGHRGDSKAATSYDMTGKASSNHQAAKGHHPIDKAHAHVPTWDELAHIHHFHKGKLKKIRRHYRKCLFMTKLLLVVCHAAVLFISYLHVIH